MSVRVLQTESALGHGEKGQNLTMSRRTAFPSC